MSNQRLKIYTRGNRDSRQRCWWRGRWKWRPSIAPIDYHRLEKCPFGCRLFNKWIWHYTISNYHSQLCHFLRNYTLFNTLLCLAVLHTLLLTLHHSGLLNWNVLLHFHRCRQIASRLIDHAQLVLFEDNEWAVSVWWGKSQHFCASPREIGKSSVMIVSHTI